MHWHPTLFNSCWRSGGWALPLFRQARAALDLVGYTRRTPLSSTGLLLVPPRPPPPPASAVLLQEAPPIPAWDCLPLPLWAQIVHEALAAVAQDGYKAVLRQAVVLLTVSQHVRCPCLSKHACSPVLHRKSGFACPQAECPRRDRMLMGSMATGLQLMVSCRRALACRWLPRPIACPSPWTSPPPPRPTFCCCHRC